MNRYRTAAALLIAVAVISIIAAGCGVVGSRLGSSSSVSGTVTYRERIALTPDATLIVQIRDTSYADASAELIAEQVISDPGQVPISFEVDYHPDDIDSRNTYSVSARIEESDGRLAFINDTAYDVITGGNPNWVDMVLVLVEPPPEMVDGEWERRGPQAGGGAGLRHRHRTAMGGRAGVRSCALRDSGRGRVLRRGREESRIDGSRIVVEVTAWVPAPTPWAMDCSDRIRELDAYVYLGSAGEELVAGETYTVEVNGAEPLTLAVP